MSEIDKTVLKALQADMVAKTEVFYDVEKRRRDREQVLMAELNATLKAEFGAERNAAEAAKKVAEEAVKAEVDRIRSIESEAAVPYPVGTKLIGWKRSRNAWTSSRDWSKSGVVGVMEIFKAGDEVPANIRWNTPVAGQIVIRLLKKDGSKAARVEIWNDSYMRNCWLPEGVKPKVNA
jgi:hypothetical protein